MYLYAELWCKWKKTKSLLKIIYVSKGLMPSRVDQSLRVAKMKRRRDQILNLVQKVSTSGQNIAPQWSTILQRKREKKMKYIFKNKQSFFARWLDGVVIDFYFNYMFQQMFWILTTFHCQVITIIYQQRALFTWNSMCFNFALCFTLDINNETTFHHKSKSIRISLVKGLWSLFQFNLSSDPSPIIVSSCH